MQADRGFQAARLALMLAGLCYLPLILLGPALTYRGSSRITALQIAFTVIMAAVCIGIASLNFLAAWGLGRCKPWAWILSVILGAIYAPSVCLPFGVVVLYGLLRNESRTLYDAAARAAR